MADTQKKDSSSTGPILGIIGSVLLPIIFSIILFVALAGKANGTSAMQPINAAPGSSESTALNSLLAKTDASAFMTANAAQISQMITQATSTQTSLQTGEARYTSVTAANRQSALSVIADLLGKLQQLQQSAASPNAGTALLAQSLADDIKKLNTYLPSVGAQLDVPVVIQGGKEWCGRTAMDMIAMYYHNGQVPPGFEANFSVSGATVTSTKSNETNVPSEAHLDSMSGKSGWVSKSAGSRSADQLFNIIKASIDGHDPILMYTDKIYYPKHYHIVVITGYDAATRTVIANNPIVDDGKQNGTEKNVRTSTNGKVPITIDFIYQHLADTEQEYHHTFLIQNKYWS